MCRPHIGFLYMSGKRVAVAAVRCAGWRAVAGAVALTGCSSFNVGCSARMALAVAGAVGFLVCFEFINGCSRAWGDWRRRVGLVWFVVMV